MVFAPVSASASEDLTCGPGTSPLIAEKWKKKLNKVPLVQGICCGERETQDQKGFVASVYLRDRFNEMKGLVYSFC